jgi:hypothetical protein
MSVTGELYTVSEIRVLRLVDARLQLLDQGHGEINHIVLDFSGARTATAAALAILGQGARRRAPPRHRFFTSSGSVLAATAPWTAAGTCPPRHPAVLAQRDFLAVAQATLTPKSRARPGRPSS